SFCAHYFTTQIYTLSLHDALPISRHLSLVTVVDHSSQYLKGEATMKRIDVQKSLAPRRRERGSVLAISAFGMLAFLLATGLAVRSEEHTSELQSLAYLVCRLLLEK